MTVAGIIPARYASSRFPGKVLTPIHGYPMVHQAYRRATLAASLDELLIATDSKAVAETCRGLGDIVVITSREHKSGTDRIAEAARDLSADLIVNIQGDEPQLNPGTIDRLVEHMHDQPHLLMGTVGSTSITAEDRADANVVKVIARDGLAAAFFRQLPPSPPEGAILRHIGLYAYRADFLQTFTTTPASAGEREFQLEQLRALEMGVAIGVVSLDETARGVDTPEDLERVVAEWHE